MRIARLPPFFFLVLAGLAGCIESPRDASPSSSPPAAEQPEWHVGQWWSYLENGERWFNMTVVGLEEKYGFQTYELEERFPTSDDGRSSATTWRDVETLGMVARETGGFPIWWDCPMNPLYPLQETGWKVCTMRTNQGVEGNVTVRIVVGNWTKIHVAAGEFDAVELTVQGREGDEAGAFAHLWYSPEVESFVRLEEPGWYTRELYAWGT